MQLIKAEKADFNTIYTEMQNSFIPEEIRERDEAFAVLSEKDYCIYKLIADGVWVGFITLWTLSEYTFIEHFAVFEKYRNRGLGARCIEQIKKLSKKLVLEAEPPLDEMKKRRIGFYERCGFHVNDCPYMQPPYKEGGEGVMLVLMSYPEPIENFESLKAELYARVYKKDLNI